jgi:hypothetical protein
LAAAVGVSTELAKAAVVSASSQFAVVLRRLLILKMGMGNGP